MPDGVGRVEEDDLALVIGEETRDVVAVDDTLAELVEDCYTWDVLPAVTGVIPVPSSRFQC